MNEALEKRCWKLVIKMLGMILAISIVQIIKKPGVKQQYNEWVAEADDVLTKLGE